MSRDIYEHANDHFFNSGVGYEYGRPDMQTWNKVGNRTTDSSRNEQDNDHDGLRGVDCSAFVWRGLKDAGYDVGNEAFATSKLYNGHHVTPYSRQHFDVIPPAAGGKPPGNLQAGDIIMLKNRTGSDQHVGIVKGYDANGNLEFIGSQTHGGPGKVTMKEGSYWDTNMEVVGALRAKPEFRTHEPAPLHGTPAKDQAPVRSVPSAPAAEKAAAPSSPHAPEHATDVLRKGDEGKRVQDMQEALKRLGYRDENGHELKPDGHFGAHTKAALERFQQANHLEKDGVAGDKTLGALNKLNHTGPRLDSADHPHNGMFLQARDAVHKLDAQYGRTPDQQSHQLAGSVTVGAVREGMTRIDHIALSDDASRAYAVQGQLNSPFKQIAEVQTQQAMATPLEQSTATLAQHTASQPAVAVQGQMQQQDLALQQQQPQRSV
ncbi:peptidoglycan hydrolase-like protein with peptidoglycan-binding domain [Luteibacter sp. 1214]|uniref:XVIPCD domain-containing protein n=1 Tax=Luteibacter sp. 1214 TaxID=2817735 RepID=UPI00285A4802|nr:XVIPCD domain-containing protein [Luteibacter sp. 1214]MDR6644135.1 peptidoglycan hydrolase-like protein with peptidoglycan-binding domain [Luteibacter sp. 1214]